MNITFQAKEIGQTGKIHNVKEIIFVTLESTTKPQPQEAASPEPKVHLQPQERFHSTIRRAPIRTNSPTGKSVNVEDSFNKIEKPNNAKRKAIIDPIGAVKKFVSVPRRQSQEKATSFLNVESKMVNLKLNTNSGFQIEPEIQREPKRAGNSHIFLKVGSNRSFI